jgi:hypothetical protein
MANIKWRIRSSPHREDGSESTNSTGATEYRIAAGNTNAIYQGTPVKPALAAGVIDVVGSAAGGTVGLLGVFWGCEYVSSTTGQKVFSNSLARLGRRHELPCEGIRLRRSRTAVRDCDFERRGCRQH